MFAPILLPQHSKLNLPNRLPGADAQHPIVGRMAPGHGFLGVARSGGGFTDLLTGKPGTVNGTPITSMRSTIGPAVSNNSVGTNDFTWTGKDSTSLDRQATFAGILIANAIGNFIFTTGKVAGGVSIGTQAGTGFIAIIWNGVLQINSTIAPALGVPHFVAISGNLKTSGNNTSYINAVMCNLVTGAISTSVVTGQAGSTPTAGDGTYQLLDRNNANLFVGWVATMAYAPYCASLARLYALAQNPWSIWYPYSVVDTLQWARMPTPIYALMPQIYM